MKGTLRAITDHSITFITRHAPVVLSYVATFIHANSLQDVFMIGPFGNEVYGRAFL